MEPDQPVQPWLHTPPDQTNEALDITPNVALWRAVLWPNELQQGEMEVSCSLAHTELYLSRAPTHLHPVRKSILGEIGLLGDIFSPFGANMDLLLVGAG